MSCQDCHRHPTTRRGRNTVYLVQFVVMHAVVWLSCTFIQLYRHTTHNEHQRRQPQQHRQHRHGGPDHEAGDVFIWDDRTLHGNTLGILVRQQDSSSTVLVLYSATTYVGRQAPGLHLFDALIGNRCKPGAQLALASSATIARGTN